MPWRLLSWLGERSVQWSALMWSCHGSQCSSSYFCSSHLKTLDRKSFAFILGFYCLVSTCHREQNLDPQLFKLPSFWAKGPRSARKPLRRFAHFKWAVQDSVQYSHESFSIWLLGQKSTKGLRFGHRAGRKRDGMKEEDNDTLWGRELNIKEQMLVKSSHCWWLPLQSPRVLKASRKSSTSYSGCRTKYKR